MYTPPAFRQDDPAWAHQFMRVTRLCTLVTATPEGLMATPLPMLLDVAEAGDAVLSGHLARANDQWRRPPIGEALAIFSGPDAYVTPSWYPSKQEAGKVVPTWNYQAVHAYGALSYFDDAPSLRDLVSRLTNVHEADRAEPWAVDDAPEPFIAAQLRGIVGVRLRIARIDAKSKLSQNRNQADQNGVVAGLSGSTRASDHEVAALMRGGKPGGPS